MVEEVKTYLDKKFSFTINEELNQETYYFETDSGDKPIKLGDGTFGVVYKVYNMKGDKCAIKLLYNNQTLSHLTHYEFIEQVLEDFSSKFGSSLNTSALELLNNLKARSKNLGLLTLDLMELGIEKEHCSFLLSKIEYYSQSIAVKRFNFETESARRIDGSFDGIIKIIGGTKKFRDSDAYKSLKPRFDELQMQISDYALVMPLYDCTLKDLLEKGPLGDNIKKYAIRRSALDIVFSGDKKIPAELEKLTVSKKNLIEEIDKQDDLEPKTKTSLIDNIYERVGYSLLKEMDFEERISTILPYLIDITGGLIELHKEDMYHLDLKPANVFVQARGRQVRAVIGDLGFLVNENSQSTKMSTSNDVLPLGTRHYRSPEQKDYFDICEVEIYHPTDSNNFGKDEVLLRVRDPKFQDSIIEIRDYIVFSKDSNRYKYYIADLSKDDGFTIITLQKEPKLRERLKPDPSTQIFLYKHQQVRTDLFGLGAIAFDMLTCGQSPERFYDNIRSLDAEDNDISEIMDLYRQVSNFQSNRPELTPIFAPFKHQASQEYAPAPIVELILKCMLYRTEDTFYKSSRAFAQTEGKQKAAEMVYQQLTVLNRKYPKKDIGNPLITLEIDSADGSKNSGDLFKKLNELQKLGLTELPSRFAQGIWYFRKLIGLVSKTMDEKHNKWFSEMLPENIVVKPEETLEFFYTIYNSKNDYKEDLKEDGVYKVFTRDVTNPFVPNYVTFIRRKIQLSSGLNNLQSFRYSFLDSSLLGDHIAEGDWLIIDNKLWKVVKLENYELFLEADDEVDRGKPLEIRDNEAYIYYKDLDPCTYYLTMLGTYLYHIFFVGLGNTTKNKPLLINIAQSSIYLNANSSSEAIRITKYDPKEDEAKKKLEPILKYIVYMYLKLTFPKNKTMSYYEDGGDDIERVRSVSRDADKLQRMIENFVGRIPSSLDDFPVKPDELQKINKHAAAKIPRIFPEEYEFNNLVLSLAKITISSGKKNSFWF